MKKIISILTIMIICFSMIGCTKTTYTKEFSYLPSNNEMKIKNFQKPTKDKSGVATYIIKNQKSKDALENYEKQLKKDGWKTTKDKKPQSITVEKGKHSALIVPTQDKNDVQLTIISK